jgi:hypothetical protein
MFKSIKCLEAGKKANELEVALQNILYAFENNNTIKMVYEGESDMKAEDIAEINNGIKSISKILELLQSVDSAILESEVNPLSREDVEQLQKEGRL